MGLFPTRKKLPINNRRFVGHVDHGKTESRRRAIRLASWRFGDAGNSTRFGYLGGALSRNALRTLIRRLKPAASPALMERGAALRAGKIARWAMDAPAARWGGFA